MAYTYRNYGQTITMYILAGIEHYDSNTDPDIFLEHMDRITNLVRGGVITDEQLSIINSALMAKTGYEVPTDAETDGYSIETLAEEVQTQGDGLAELGELVSSLIDPE